jgi:hypothetical protein
MTIGTIMDAAAEAETATLLWALAGALMLLAVLSIFAEQRRTRRPNLDAPGWVPWNLLQILCFLLAIAVAVLAIRS